MDSNFKIPVNEYDGKVVYGQKRANSSKLFYRIIYNDIWLVLLWNRGEFNMVHSVSLCS